MNGLSCSLGWFRTFNDREREGKIDLTMKQDMYWNIITYHANNHPEKHTDAMEETPEKLQCFRNYPWQPKVQSRPRNYQQNSKSSVPLKCSYVYRPWVSSGDVVKTNPTLLHMCHRLHFGRRYLHHIYCEPFTMSSVFSTSHQLAPLDPPRNMFSSVKFDR